MTNFWYSDKAYEPPGGNLPLEGCLCYECFHNNNIFSCILKKQPRKKHFYDVEIFHARFSIPSSLNSDTQTYRAHKKIINKSACDGTRGSMFILWVFGDKIYSQQSERQFEGILDFYLSSGVFVECLMASRFDCQGKQSSRCFTAGRKYVFLGKSRTLLVFPEKMFEAAPCHHPRSSKSLFKSPMLLFLLFLFKSRAEWTKST